MNILEAILATIGAYFSLVFVLGCICALYSTIVDRRHARRGGLLDLTPSSDSRKNARGGVVIDRLFGAIDDRPWLRRMQLDRIIAMLCLAGMFLGAAALGALALYGAALVAHLGWNAV